MATLRSTWTATPLVVDGNLGTAEWAKAGTMPINSGQVAAIASDSYAAHAATHAWAGVSGDSHAFNPPVSCAYELRVTASPNTTNGYCRFSAAMDPAFSKPFPPVPVVA